VLQAFRQSRKRENCRNIECFQDPLPSLKDSRQVHFRAQGWESFRRDQKHDLKLKISELPGEQRNKSVR
jgi:hypothetical protein